MYLKVHLSGDFKDYKCDECGVQSKKIRGCSEEPTGSIYLLEEKQYRCPIALLNEGKEYINEINEVLDLYFSCKEMHVLPYEGGYMLSQPNPIYTVFNFIRRILNYIDAKKYEIALKKAKQK